MQRLEKIEKRLSAAQQAQELSLTPVNPITSIEAQKKLTDGQPVVNSGAAAEVGSRHSRPGDWVTPGELYRLLQQRGFTKSDTTFRRMLAAAVKAGELPGELKDLGIDADFEYRRSGKAKDNSLKWLRVMVSDRPKAIAP